MLIFYLVGISDAKDDLISNKVENLKFLESNHVDLSDIERVKSRSKRAMYYRNDPESMRNDMRRRLWLARNPIFGNFGRYSRMFRNIFGIGNQPMPSHFNNDYYSDYSDNYYDYPSYSNSYDYYNYGSSRRPSSKNGHGGAAKKGKKYVGVKLSNKYPSDDLSDDSFYGSNLTIAKDRTSKLSSILNKIRFGNETSSSKKSEPLSNSIARTKQTLNDLKKQRTSSYLVERKFPDIDKLALKIASNMESSGASTTTKKSFLSEPKTTTKDYFLALSTQRTTTRNSKKTNVVEKKESQPTKSPITIKSGQTSSNEKKFNKVDKLASRIVSHFI